MTISRALRATTFPADFILVAAMNPCPCGYRSDPRRACGCSPPQVEKYLGRISGPLLDRIDLHVEVPAVPFAQLAEAPPGPTSADFLAEVVLRARARQAERFGPQGPGVNGRMTPRQVRKYLPPEAGARGHAQGGDGGAGPLGEGPRQGAPRRADDGRPRRVRRHQPVTTSPRPSATGRSTGASGPEELPMAASPALGLPLGSGRRRAIAAASALAVLAGAVALAMARPWEGYGLGSPGTHDLIAYWGAGQLLKAGAARTTSTRCWPSSGRRGGRGRSRCRSGIRRCCWSGSIHS